MALNFIWMDYALRGASLLHAPERVIDFSIYMCWKKCVSLGHYTTQQFRLATQKLS